MDHETDFLSADFLALTMFAQRNLIIYPFVLAQKLTPLTAVLSACYNVENADLSVLSTPDSVDYYLNTLQQQNATISDAKQTLLLFPNGCKGYLSMLKKYPAVRFIGIETEMAPELCSPEFTLYNKKTQQFEQWDRKTTPQDPYAEDVQNWCQFLLEQLTPLLDKKPDTIAQHSDLVTFWTAAQELYRAVAGDHLTEASAIRRRFGSVEYHALESFTSRYFHLNLPEIPLTPEPSLSSKPLSEPTSPSSVHFNSHPNEDHFGEIIAIKAASPSIYVAFETMLNSVAIDDTTRLLSPETKYVYLREHAWSTGIPLTAMVDLLRNYLQERLKQVKLAAPGFEKFVRMEWKTILDAFALVNFDPKFKQKASLPITSWQEDPKLTTWFIPSNDVLPKTSPKPKVTKADPSPSTNTVFTSTTPSPPPETDWILEDVYQRKLADIRARLAVNPLDYYALLDQEFERVMAQARQVKK